MQATMQRFVISRIGITIFALSILLNVALLIIALDQAGSLPSTNRVEQGMERPVAYHAPGMGEGLLNSVLPESTIMPKAYDAPGMGEGRLNLAAATPTMVAAYTALGEGEGCARIWPGRPGPRMRLWRGTSEPGLEGFLELPGSVIQRGSRTSSNQYQRGGTSTDIRRQQRGSPRMRTRITALIVAVSIMLLSAGTGLAAGNGAVTSTTVTKDVVFTAATTDSCHNEAPVTFQSIEHNVLPRHRAGRRRDPPPRPPIRYLHLHAR